MAIEARRYLTESPPPRPRAVFARHAAILVLVRQSKAGPEVLMGVRSRGHRFMPNRLVFPGGAVDPADAAAPAATEPAPHLLAMLERSAPPRLARAIAHAAARELQEETGVSLGAPPRLHALEYLCRAVTPPGSPIRFNARFLIAPAEAMEGTPEDTRELQDVAWRRIEDVKDNVVLVTGEVLARLGPWLALPESVRQNRTGLDVFKRRSWQTE